MKGLPGGPGADSVLPLQEVGLNPWSGNYIPNATTKTWQSQINKLNKFKKRIDEEKKRKSKKEKK